MVEFNHIIVPTDFGEAAGCAAELAIDLAGKYKAKVTLVHAFMVPAVAYGDAIAFPVDSMINAAEDALAKAVSQLRARYPNTSALLVRGEPWEEILAVARDRGADMIVMGTHGRRGLSRVFLGSVAEKVVRLSPVPVVTVSAPPAAKEKAASPSYQSA